MVRKSFNLKNCEQGSVLIIVLVLLSVMLVISFGALQITSLNTDMAGSHKKGKQAFYAAEVGLDVGVNDIIN